MGLQATSCHPFSAKHSTPDCQQGRQRKKPWAPEGLGSSTPPHPAAVSMEDVASLSFLSIKKHSLGICHG